ncbi:hypothetical protein F4780DRAFT_501292 [Xylariomycetidae sp. FL0641]|nr:hypothetical protein F4780DRAFT_501292 [Xylariomycetidae sp. FL0641]
MGTPMGSTSAQARFDEFDAMFADLGNDRIEDLAYDGHNNNQRGRQQLEYSYHGQPAETPREAGPAATMWKNAVASGMFLKDDDAKGVQNLDPIDDGNLHRRGRATYGTDQSYSYSGHDDHRTGRDRGASAGRGGRGRGGLRGGRGRGGYSPTELPPIRGLVERSTDLFKGLQRYDPTLPGYSGHFRGSLRGNHSRQGRSGRTETTLTSLGGVPPPGAETKRWGPMKSSKNLPLHSSDGASDPPHTSGGKSGAFSGPGLTLSTRQALWDPIPESRTKQSASTPFGGPSTETGTHDLGSSQGTQRTAFIPPHLRCLPKAASGSSQKAPEQSAPAASPRPLSGANPSKGKEVSSVPSSERTGFSLPRQQLTQQPSPGESSKVKAALQAAIQSKVGHGSQDTGTVINDNSQTIEPNLPVSVAAHKHDELQPQPLSEVMDVMYQAQFSVHQGHGNESVTLPGSVTLFQSRDGLLGILELTVDGKDVIRADIRRFIKCIQSGSQVIIRRKAHEGPDAELVTKKIHFSGIRLAQAFDKEMDRRRAEFSNSTEPAYQEVHFTVTNPALPAPSQISGVVDPVSRNEQEQAKVEGLSSAAKSSTDVQGTTGYDVVAAMAAPPFCEDSASVEQSGDLLEFTPSPKKHDTHGSNDHAIREEECAPDDNNDQPVSSPPPEAQGPRDTVVRTMTALHLMPMCVSASGRADERTLSQRALAMLSTIPDEDWNEFVTLSHHHEKIFRSAMDTSILPLRRFGIIQTAGLYLCGYRDFLDLPKEEQVQLLLVVATKLLSTFAGNSRIVRTPGEMMALRNSAWYMQGDCPGTILEMNSILQQRDWPPSPAQPKYEYSREKMLANVRERDEFLYGGRRGCQLNPLHPLLQESANQDPPFLPGIKGGFADSAPQPFGNTAAPANRPQASGARLENLPPHKRAPHIVRGATGGQGSASLGGSEGTDGGKMSSSSNGEVSQITKRVASLQLGGQSFW